MTMIQGSAQVFEDLGFGAEEPATLKLRADKHDKIAPIPKQKGSTHVQRRLSQRAISEAMIKIALLYGQKQYRYGAQLFTLNDRNLKTEAPNQLKV